MSCKVKTYGMLAFVRKVKRIYEEVNEQNVEELYEFMSEEDMKNANPPFSENLAFYFDKTVS